MRKPPSFKTLMNHARKDAEEGFQSLESWIGNMHPDEMDVEQNRINKMRERFALFMTQVALMAKAHAGESVSKGGQP